MTTEIEKQIEELELFDATQIEPVRSAYMTTVITTVAELSELINKIKNEPTHFIGYQQPLVMISVDNEMYEVPIGYFIPALIKELSPESL